MRNILFFTALFLMMNPTHALSFVVDRVAEDAATRVQIENLKRLDSEQIKTEVAGRASEHFDSTKLGTLSPDLPKSLGFYPAAYGFDRIQAHSEVSWGVLQLSGFDLFTMKITPTHPNGKLIVFAHGYLDHIGRYSSFLDKLARQGFTVVAYDLPGHGLSSGDSASIPHFKIYAEVYAEVLKLFSAGYAETVMVGFSTGGSAILQARMYGLVDPALRAVLVSPLVRIKYWQVAEPAFLSAFYLRYANNWSVLDLLISPATQVTAVTRDALFLESHRLDPLRPAKIPSFWTMAYVRYAEVLQKWASGLTPAHKASFAETLIVAGRDDSVVDASLGVDFIAQTFANQQSVWIPKGGHHLLNEGIAHFRKPKAAVDLLPLVLEPIFQFIERSK